jgi:hypothetical protein
MKITLEWKLLERISAYYGFPSAVFLSPISSFPKKKTRDKVIFDKARLYDKIKEIVEEGNDE